MSSESKSKSDEEKASNTGIFGAMGAMFGARDDFLESNTDFKGPVGTDADESNIDLNTKEVAKRQLDEFGKRTKEFMRKH